MIRDLTTLERGESVTVHEGEFIVRDGKYVGFLDDAIVVDLGPVIDRVPLSDEDRFVTDDHGRSVGVAEHEPDLNGSPPELE